MTEINEGGKKMNRKILGICVCMLVIATVIPGIEAFDSSAITSMEKNGIIQSSEQIINPCTIGRSVLFSQLPYQPDQPWSAFTSSSLFPYLCQEDFWGLTDAIEDVHWWGLTLIWDPSTGWLPGSPDGMKFEIKFYQDSGGLPGAVVATFSNVAPTFTDTGLIYAGWTMFFFETDIQSLGLPAGWLSVQTTYSPDDSNLLWMTSPDGNNNALQEGNPLNANLAFELTHKPRPDLTYEGSLGWSKVKPGDTVSGSFQVGNMGESDSLLNWQVASWPGWGNWTFSPNAGTGLAQGNWIRINVFVIAPPDTKMNFTGTVKIVNTDDPSDFSEIPVYLSTPLNQGIHTQSFFERFFERFPHAFPILRHLLGY